MSRHVTDGDFRSEKNEEVCTLVHELSSIIYKWWDETIALLWYGSGAVTVSQRTNLFATHCVVEHIFRLNSGWDVWKLCRTQASLLFASCPVSGRISDVPGSCWVNASNSPSVIVAIRNPPTNFWNCLLSGVPSLEITALFFKIHHQVLRTLLSKQILPFTPSRLWTQIHLVISSLIGILLPRYLYLYI